MAKLKYPLYTSLFTVRDRSSCIFAWAEGGRTAAQSPYFLTFMEPRNRFQGMNSASLCSLAGRHDNPIPPRFLAHIDSLKIPAQLTDEEIMKQHTWAYAVYVSINQALNQLWRAYARVRLVSGRVRMRERFVYQQLIPFSAPAAKTRWVLMHTFGGRRRRREILRTNNQCRLCIVLSP
jgi:hypothetical protein